MTSEKTLVWNPWLIVLAAIPFGYLWGTVLVALNWHFLKRHWIAAAVWVGGAVFLVFVQNVACDTFPGVWPYLITFLVWFPVIGLPQVLSFRKHANRTQSGRGWLLPIAIGIALQIVVTIWDAKELKDIKEASLLQPPTLPVVQQSQSQELTPKQVYDKMAGSVVEVVSTWTESNYIIFNKQAEARGSAVLLSAEAGDLYYVTNRHVVSAPEGAWNVRLFIEVSQRRIPSNIIAFRKDGVDLAIIGIHVPEATEKFEMPYLCVKDIHIGQKCVAIGNALGAGNSLTEGIVSRFDDMGGWTALRTSAPISPGNSGGALFSLDGGYLIGITTQIIAPGEAQNVNQAIPVDYFAQSDSWEFLPQSQP